MKYKYNMKNNYYIAYIIMQTAKLQKK